MQPTILSCIQPTSEIHIGNYFGAIQNWCQLQEHNNCYFGVVDLHAMTMPYKPQELYRHSRDMYLGLMACGISLEKSTLFLQSLVPAHTKLCWMLSCFCAQGDLSRMVQFKEKSKQQMEQSKSTDSYISSGLLFYPILQAADILAYQPDLVPVGIDQKQHLELTKAIVKKVNAFLEKDFFHEPKPLFTKISKVMSLSNPALKMSKSLGSRNYISVFDSPDAINKKIKSAVTDMGPSEKEIGPGIQNLFAILLACGADSLEHSLREDYFKGALKYSYLKSETSKILIDTFAPIREKRKELEKMTNKDVNEIIDVQSKNAHNKASETVASLAELLGIS